MPLRILHSRSSLRRQPNTVSIVTQQMVRPEELKFNLRRIHRQHAELPAARAIPKLRVAVRWLLMREQQVGLPQNTTASAGGLGNGANDSYRKKDAAMAVKVAAIASWIEASF
eukprot:1951128-Rhodomonas_salina.2